MLSSRTWKTYETRKRCHGIWGLCGTSCNPYFVSLGVCTGCSANVSAKKGGSAAVSNPGLLGPKNMVNLQLIEGMHQWSTPELLILSKVILYESSNYGAKKASTISPPKKTLIRLINIHSMRTTQIQGVEWKTMRKGMINEHA